MAAASGISGGGESMSRSVELPGKEQLLASLRRSHVGPSGDEELLRAISERLHSRVYEEAAFTFILMEIVYEHEDRLAGEAGAVLHSAVLALSADEELADTARRAFAELRASLAV